MESFKKIIGKKIQRRRVERGFANQASLAERLGVDQSQITKWETGTHLPEGKHKRNLQEALHVDDSFFEMISIEDMLLDGRKAELFNLILRLPDVQVATFTTIAQGLLGEPPMNQKKPGT